MVTKSRNVKSITFLPLEGSPSGIAQGAKDKGFEKKNIFSFQDKKSLLEKLLEILKPGDVVLFKGSRKMGLEEIVDGLKKLYPVKS